MFDINDRLFFPFSFSVADQKPANKEGFARYHKFLKIYEFRLRDEISNENFQKTSNFGRFLKFTEKSWKNRLNRGFFLWIGRQKRQRVQVGNWMRLVETVGFMRV